MKWLWIKVRRKIIKNNDFAALLRTLTKFNISVSLHIAASTFIIKP